VTPRGRSASTKFGMFRRDGDHENAFLTAMYLCLLYDMTFGNFSASPGWLAKATRVVEDCGLDALRGWVLLCEAVTLQHQDPVAAEEKARQALDLARVFKASNKIIDIAWDLAIGSDLSLPEVEGERPFLTRLSNAWAERILQAAERDPYVASVFGSVTDLLAPPSVLMRPRFVWRVASSRRLGKTPTTSHRGVGPPKDHKAGWNRLERICMRAVPRDSRILQPPSHTPDVRGAGSSRS
jgi:hypothetical protein